MEAPSSSGSETQIQWRLKSWFPHLADPTLTQLKAFFSELIKWNKNVNLVSAKSIQNADALHFADCISACELVHKNVINSRELYDIGSGNGFPGIVYAILYPAQKVILVEVEDRKAEFLNHVAKSLGLANITVINKKVESFGLETIFQAICRDFAPLPNALLTLRKIVQNGGFVFHMKTSEWSKEVSQIPIQLCSSWQPVLIGEYKLPLGDINLFVVKTDKIS